MVENPGRNGLDTERVEHAEADLRMALEHEALRFVQRARLAQDLLWNGELAEVVKRAREARQLHLIHLEAHAPSDSCS